MLVCLSAITLKTSLASYSYNTINKAQKSYIYVLDFTFKKIYLFSIYLVVFVFLLFIFIYRLNCKISSLDEGYTNDILGTITIHKRFKVLASTSYNQYIRSTDISFWILRIPLWLNLPQMLPTMQHTQSNSEIWPVECVAAVCWTVETFIYRATPWCSFRSIVITFMRRGTDRGHAHCVPNLITTINTQCDHTVLGLVGLVIVWEVELDLAATLCLFSEAVFMNIKSPTPKT